MTSSTVDEPRCRVHSATPADYERWRVLYRGYADFYGAQQPERGAVDHRRRQLPGRAKYDQYATRTTWITYDMTP